MTEPDNVPTADELAERERRAAAARAEYEKALADEAAAREAREAARLAKLREYDEAQVQAWDHERARLELEQAVQRVREALHETPLYAAYLDYWEAVQRVIHVAQAAERKAAELGLDAEQAEELRYTTPAPLEVLIARTIAEEVGQREAARQDAEAKAREAYAALQ
jgi:multidrug efflux pump subunit AcrB